MYDRIILSHFVDIKYLAQTLFILLRVGIIMGYDRNKKIKIKNAHTFLLIYLLFLLFLIKIKKNFNSQCPLQVQHLPMSI